MSITNGVQENLPKNRDNFLKWKLMYISFSIQFYATKSYLLILIMSMSMDIWLLPIYNLDSYG